MEKKEAMENAEKKGRTIYFDSLRVMATFAVIVLHTASQKWGVGSAESWEWQILNFYDSLVRWSVPVFVMISGALFLDKDQPVRKLYKKNIARIAAAFICWSSLYAAVDLITTQCGWKQGVKRMLLGPGHMWFLFMIVGLYMIVPFLRQIVKSMELTRYFLVLSFVFACFLPQAITVISIKFPSIGILANAMLSKVFFHFTLGYAGYFVCGYYLSKIEFSKNAKRIIYALGVCGFLITVLGTSYLSILQQGKSPVFYEYLTVNVLLESVCVFVFAKDKLQGERAGEKAKAILGKLSEYSFGAYLIHYMLVVQFDLVGNFHVLTFCPLISVPVISVIVFVISICISWAAHQIPLLRNTV